jgi:hypothetical protein
MLKMSIFGFKALIKIFNRYEKGNLQKHLHSHVIKFLVLFIIVKV